MFELCSVLDWIWPASESQLVLFIGNKLPSCTTPGMLFLGKDVQRKRYLIVSGRGASLINRDILHKHFTPYLNNCRENKKGQQEQ